MILVTGGTGFLGRHLIVALCRAGYQQRVLTRHPDAYPWLAEYPDVEIVVGDLHDMDSLRRAAEGCTAIVHAAGLFSMWSGAGDFTLTNTQGTDNIARIALEVGVSKLIYISTIAVIGTPQPDRIIDESHPPNPDDLYQQSKYDAEQVLLRHYQLESLPIVILRPGAFYGPHGEYAFNRLFFADPMRGIIMQMDGGRYKIFPVYVGDVADSIVLALEKGRIGETYNICGTPITHRNAYDIVTEIANLRFPRLNIPGFVGRNFSRLLEIVAKLTHREPFYPLGLKSYVFNNWSVTSEKAKKELGYQPTSFYDGASKTIAWYRAGKPDSDFLEPCKKMNKSDTTNH